MTEEEARRIKGLIASLAKMDRPDIGFSPILSGQSFSPIPNYFREIAILPPDELITPSPVLQSLVALGPDALPFLLDSLDDPTPTKLTIRDSDNHYGRIYIKANALSMNPVNPIEREVFAKRENPEPGTSRTSASTPTRSRLGTSAS